MTERYLNLVRGLSTHWLGKLGVILTTSSFVCLILLELARIAGIVTSSYAGLVTYMLFPVLFVLGLILIPIGWLKLKRQTGKTTSDLMKTRFKPDDSEKSLLGSKLVRTIGILTVINVIFLVGISSRMFAFMDTPKFCGTACHSVMNPEWVTYQKSPHSRVACVECHVGEGADALIDSKLNGLWQIISISFDLLERPIPTPVHQLRPARETCEKCHWPDKFYGTRLQTIARYQDDSLSSPSYTTLNLKIDAGSAAYRSGIHWHVAEENEVRYSSLNDERERILWAEVRRPDGTFHRYTSMDRLSQGDEVSSVRTMDCVDCHNRATHIYDDPERAVDHRIQWGILDRSLPYFKREALKAITAGYPDRQAAMDGIANQMHGYYQRNHPEIGSGELALIDSVVAVLQAVYNRNIHPEMNIGWGAYKSHIGHKGDGGCFRCHNSRMVDENGSAISNDCALCHSMLANGHDDPFKFLQPVDTADIDYQMHLYLQEEFLQSFNK